MKKKVLTYQQARELKWFCENVAGVRQDMYRTEDIIIKFEEKIKKLEATCDLINNFLSQEKPEPEKEG